MSEVKEMNSMSCRPTKKRLKEGTILDEDMSVKWNREEVARHNEEIDFEVKSLNTKKNKWRDSLTQEILEKIIDEAEMIDNTEQANLLYQYVMSNFGDYSIEYTFERMEELVDLFNDLQN